MSRTGLLVVIALVPGWLAGCTPDEVVGPIPADPALPALSQAAGSPADIGGVWQLSRELQVTAPDWVAESIFGIEPEGPVTIFRCISSGSMTVTQAGNEFSGTASWVSNDCETHGGQVFSAGFPPIAIQGRISGRSVHLEWTEAGMIVCPHRATVQDLDGQAAGRLQGTGRCILPGHPHSPVPLDPPPAGTSNTLEWVAVRS
jgi:hypothetical protein